MKRVLGIGIALLLLAAGLFGVALGVAPDHVAHSSLDMIEKACSSPLSARRCGSMLSRAPQRAQAMRRFSAIAELSISSRFKLNIIPSEAFIHCV